MGKKSFWSGSLAAFFFYRQLFGRTTLPGGADKYPYRGFPLARIQCSTKLRSICSSDFPFVSGIIFHTNSNCTTIITLKNKKVFPPPSFSVREGKEKAMSAAMHQCVKLPSVCPFALTWFGKISEIKTHITAPWLNAKKAMYTNK